MSKQFIVNESKILIQQQIPQNKQSDNSLYQSKQQKVDEKKKIKKDIIPGSKQHPQPIKYLNETKQQKVLQVNLTDFAKVDQDKDDNIYKYQCFRKIRNDRFQRKNYEEMNGRLQSLADIRLRDNQGKKKRMQRQKHFQKQIVEQEDNLSSQDYEQVIRMTNKVVKQLAETFVSSVQMQQQLRRFSQSELLIKEKGYDEQKILQQSLKVQNKAPQKKTGCKKPLLELTQDTFAKQLKKRQISIVQTQFIVKNFRQSALKSEEIMKKKSNDSYRFKMVKRQVKHNKFALQFIKQSRVESIKLKKQILNRIQQAIKEKLTNKQELEQIRKRVLSCQTLEVEQIQQIVSKSQLVSSKQQEAHESVKRVSKSQTLQKSKKLEKERHHEKLVSFLQKLYDLDDPLEAQRYQQAKKQFLRQKAFYHANIRNSTTSDENRQKMIQERIKYLKQADKLGQIKSQLESLIQKLVPSIQKLNYYVTKYHTKEQYLREELQLVKSMTDISSNQTLQVSGRGQEFELQVSKNGYSKSELIKVKLLELKRIIAYGQLQHNKQSKQKSVQ